MENVADRAVQRIHGLIAPGETVLPSNERVARELAKYPKSERRLIWKRPTDCESLMVRLPGNPRGGQGDRARSGSAKDLDGRAY